MLNKMLENNQINNQHLSPPVTIRFVRTSLNFMVLGTHVGYAVVYRNYFGTEA